MSVITVEYARKQLLIWYEAMEVVASGQEYKIGSRMLSMPHLKEIREQIKYWENKLAELQRGGRKSRRAYNIVPVDI